MNACATGQVRTLRLFKNAVGRAVHFSRQVLAILQEGLDIRDGGRQGELTADDLAERFIALEIILDEFVSRPRQNADNQWLASHLKNHLRGSLAFLEPGVDATNHRAEQALR